jgi:transcriptional regulator with XRE-family HTH domain
MTLPQYDPAVYRYLLGAALKIRRYEGNLSLRASARKIGIAASTLGRIEAGRGASPLAIKAACEASNLLVNNYLPPQVSRETSRENAP